MNSDQNNNCAWLRTVYVKATNGDVADWLNKVSISSDGTTVVAATPYEDSTARGINDNQRDNSARDSGAAYIFTNKRVTKTASPIDSNKR